MDIIANGDNDINLLEEQGQQLQDHNGHQQHLQEDELDQDEINALREARDLEMFARACVWIQQNDPYCDVFLGDSDVNDRKAVLLGRALIGNTELRKLLIVLMSQAEFTSQGARILIEGIVCSQVKTLHLEGDEEPPLEISHLCVTSIVNLSLHIPMGVEFVTRLCECLLMYSKSLQHFLFRVDTMTPHVAQILSNFLQRSPVTSLALIAGLGNTTPLETIQTLYLEAVQNCQGVCDLYLRRIVGDIHALATTVPKLHQLSIREVDLSLSEVELLTYALSNANQLHTLSLQKCGLNHEHMSVLAPVLGNHRSIKSVSFYDNQIGDAGVALFVDHWAPESKVEELVLSLNGIGFKGTELLLANILSCHLVLCSLKLSFNELIGFRGLQLIGEALSDSKIQKLDLCMVVNWYPYDDDVCDAALIQEAKRMAAGKALLEGVRGNGHLVEVKLDSCLPFHLEKEINLYVKANALGRRAVFENQYMLPRGIWGHFFAKEGMNSSLLFLFLRELPSLMTGCGSCK